MEGPGAGRDSDGMTSSLTPVAQPSPARTPPPGRRRALLGISAAYFMVLIDTTVLSVAEPDLARSLGSSTAGLQWAFTGYTVVFAALLLSGGAISDRFGAHRAFRAGIAVFGLGSLLSAFAPNLWTLVLLRGVLGAAAAAAVPATLSIITRLYPVPAERARAVATWAAISGSAMACGPLLGGFLVDLDGWRAVFLINVPLAALTLALTAGSLIHAPRGRTAIDWPAQLAACATLGLLTDALIALGAGSTLHAACSGAGALATAALLVRLERRSAAPVVSAALLRAPGMPGLLLAGAAVNFAMSGMIFVLPLLLQQQWQLTPLMTGLAFLPMSLPPSVNPLLTGRIVARIGPAKPVLGGLLLLAAGSLAFGAAILAGAPYAGLTVGLLCCGFGVSFALPALVAAVVTTAPAGTAGAAGGLLSSIRQVGATIGIAAMGAFVTAGHPGTPHSGFARPLAWAELIPAAACALSALLVARHRKVNTLGR